MHIFGAARATVQNFAVNYISTLVLAYIIFEEPLTMRKLLGVTLILLGISVIASGGR